MSAWQWAQLCLLGTIWGSSFFFGKLALEQYGPLSIVLARVVLAALTLNILLPLTGQRLPTSLRLWGAFFIMGLFNSLIPFSLIFWGQQFIPSGLAAILNATTPLFAVPIGHFITRSDRATPLRVIGTLAGFAGVVVMLAPGIAFSGSNSVLAQLAVLLAALLYAASGYYARRFHDLPTLVPATGQVTATAVMMLPLALLLEQPWQQGAPQPLVLVSLLSLGLISTAFAYIIYFRLLRSAGTSNLLLVTFLIPVSATILGSTLLHERLAFWHYAGMACIAAGLACIDGRLFSLWKRPPAAAAAPAFPAAAASPVED